MPTGDFIVTNCNDSGSGSLRDIASQIGEGSSINLTALTCSTITLTSGAVNFSVDDITLYGPGSDKLTIVGNGSDRVIGHSGGGTLNISGLMLANGAITGSGGGCVYSAGRVVLRRSVVSSCHTYSHGAYDVLGGGVYTKKDLDLVYSTITLSTVEADSARAYGGGAFVRGSLTMYSSTISDNIASGYVGNTGGVVVIGDALIHNSTISGNESDFNAGLGLFAQTATERLRIDGSTISGNVANNEVGGVGVLADTIIRNSTITNNRDAVGLGAGLFLGGTAAVELQSTIVADNFSGFAHNDVVGYSGTALTGANDLIMTSNLTVPPGTLSSDPQLAPLADNGGPTLTHALLPGSPAIDAGNNDGDFNYDQRTQGAARIVGSAADIGAYEVQSTGATTQVANCNDGGAGSLRNAIDNAVSGDTIDLSQLACSTITLTGGALQVAPGNLTLRGPGAGLLTIDGNNADRVLHHEGGGTLSLSGLTVAHGYFIVNGFAAGGCIYGLGTVTLDSARVTSCQVVSSANAGYSEGGGVYSSRLDMRSSVVSNNHAAGLIGNARGGGVYAYAASIQDSTLSGNSALAGSRAYNSFGGGLWVDGRSTILRSTIFANQAQAAAGAYLTGDGEVIDSTISGNSALVFVGGLLASSTLSLYNSTVAFNTGSQAYDVGAGVVAESTVRLQSSIVFGNTNGSSSYDIGSIQNGLVIGSHNLVGVSHIPLPGDTIDSDPLLGPLQDNGGATLTHALLAGSPAIDAGDNGVNLDTDQRGAGFARVIGPAADIGAFEAQGSDAIFSNGFD